MYCSIDKIDLAAEVDGKPIALQTDHRNRDDIEAEPELSALFAMARIVNARAQLADDGHPLAAVHYVVNEDPPELLREALAAAGGIIERSDRDQKILESLGPADEREVGLIADRCMTSLARRAATRVGTRDLAMALRMLEDQTLANPPERERDEAAYWVRVIELAALTGELLRAKYQGCWVQTDRAMVPFAFQIATVDSAMMFPTNRAQRVIEDGAAESLFKLLIAAEETLHRPADVANARLMPSLRQRRDVVLEEVVWRPVISDDAPTDLPIVVCGIDGDSTYGMLRREALPKPPDRALDEAIANLEDEAVQCDEIAIGDTAILIVSGSFYAAEKLLDREFMRSLHRTLAADLLAAATPARGCLLVSAVVDEPAAIARFSGLARRRYDEAGGRSISPAVVLVSDGRVAGYVRGPNDEREASSEHKRADTAPEAPAEKKRGLLRRLFGRK
ncbi:MAG TPA: hypothetical protein VH143_02350 [Kofleriaceae bacterium]|jgi:hypothetical protein|nr:hypothetical protein [Kofleriaceae bacterium]